MTDEAMPTTSTRVRLPLGGLFKVIGGLWLVATWGVTVAVAWSGWSTMRPDERWSVGVLLVVVVVLTAWVLACAVRVRCGPRAIEARIWPLPTARLARDRIVTVERVGSDPLAAHGGIVPAAGPAHDRVLGFGDDGVRLIATDASGSEHRLTLLTRGDAAWLLARLEAWRHRGGQ